MADTRDTVARLVALATNAAASPEEARTAAMAAVRLIQEHALLDSGSGWFGARPQPHCAGCRCFSTEDWGRYKPPSPRPPGPVWREDFDEEPKPEADRNYSSGWDRVWGTK